MSECSIGVFPNGPSFLPGSGTVSAAVNLHLDLLSTSTTLGSQTINGKHTGSIDGPPGAHSSDDMELRFSESGTYTPDELYLFKDTSLNFGLTLSVTGEVLADQGGAKFGARGNWMDLAVDITYDYEPNPVPVPASLWLFGSGFLLVRRITVLRIK